MLLRESRFFCLSVLSTLLFIVVNGSSFVDAQTPTSYYLLQDGVPFVNATNTTGVYGFRYAFEDPIQPDQDLLLTLLCANGNNAATCSAQVSNRPDMLTTITECSAYWELPTMTYCRIPSCLMASSTIDIALNFATTSFKTPIQAFFNISTTLETNTPTKV